MKLLDNFNSQVDHVLNSFLTFLTFIIIKVNFGLDLSGYFGLILSISAFIETIQGGLYERPVYLKQSIGYKNFKLNTPLIFLMSIFLNFFVYLYVFSESLIGGILFCISTVLLRNIKTYDYINDEIISASKRSIYIFTITIIYFFSIYFDILNHNFNTFLLVVSLIKMFFVAINKEKIFKITNTAEEPESQNLKILTASLLILIKSRLPLWVLLPFGLGLIGIYETFRTLIEIFLLPSKGILNVMVKEIDESSVQRILRTGLISGSITALILFLSYNFITSLELYNHPEIRNIESLLSGTLLVLFFWMSETNSMILQYKNLHNLEISRRLIAILIFIILNLAFQELINYKIFIILISTMYVFENLPVFIYRLKKL